VEAEPSHFRWMREVFKDNGLDPRQHRLIEAAVSDKDGEVVFHVGNPQEWWGQRFAAGDKPDSPETLVQRLRRLGARFLGMTGPAGPAKTGLRRVRAVTLNNLLADLGTIDLIDSDIQGEEAMVFESAAALVDAQVKRVHVATHDPDGEERLRALFRGL